MNEELVYIKTKNGDILKCYVSEQMHKPIYYPVNSKTNGYVDYNDVEKKLDIEDMYIIVKQLQQQLKDIKEYIGKEDISKYVDCRSSDGEDKFKQPILDIINKGSE